MDGYRTSDCPGCGKYLLVIGAVTSAWCSNCQAWQPVLTTGNRPASGNGNITMLSPWNSQRLGQYPAVQGNKRALLCAVSYRNTVNELKGAGYHVNCMKDLLKNKFSFPESCILVLSEDEKDPSRIPTKQSIRNAMQWLVNGCKAGDSLVFHFSGHGIQVVDDNGDEEDGYDEALLPVDYEQEKEIVDDEINATIVRPLPAGAKLHAIIDASHSGTVLDLPFVCKTNKNGQFKWKNESPACTYKGTSGGLAIAFSSCDDSQSQDAFSDKFSLVKKEGQSSTSGVMTYSFIRALECSTIVTYGSLLNSMKSAVLEARTGYRATGAIASRLMKILPSNMAQEPQLSASEKFDVDRKQFSL